MTISLYKIAGELTPAVAARLERALEALPRVVAVFIDVAGGEAEVQHQGADLAQIGAVVQSLGLLCSDSAPEFSRAS